MPRPTLKQYIFSIVPEGSAPMRFIKKIYGAGLAMSGAFSTMVFGRRREKEQQMAFLRTYIKPGMRILDTQGSGSFFSRTAKALCKDIIIAAAKDDQVDMMRVDLNGGELPFFESVKPLLSGSAAPVIIYNSSSALTATFGYHPVETLWFLEGLGYRFINRSLRQYEGIIIAQK
jgi:hypothetical protein